MTVGNDASSKVCISRIACRLRAQASAELLASRELPSVRESELLLYSTVIKKSPKR